MTSWEEAALVPNPEPLPLVEWVEWVVASKHHQSQDLASVKTALVAMDPLTAARAPTVLPRPLRTAASSLTAPLTPVPPRLIRTVDSRATVVNKPTAAMLQLPRHPSMAEVTAARAMETTTAHLLMRLQSHLTVAINPTAHLSHLTVASHTVGTNPTVLPKHPMAVSPTVDSPTADNPTADNPTAVSLMATALPQRAPTALHTALPAKATATLEGHPKVETNGDRPLSERSLLSTSLSVNK